MPGGGQGVPWWRMWCSGFGVLVLSVRVTSCDGRGRAGSSQPYLGPRGCECPGDMMIDRVSPPCGDAAAQSNQAVRLARQGRQRLTAARRELAAGFPIG